MAVFSIKGSKFEIGAAVALKAADFVAADFTEPLSSATEVKEPETFGVIGDEWALEDFTNATTGRTVAVKFSRKGKGIEFTFGADPADAGQLAMRAASESEGNFAFRFTMADKPATGAEPKNSTRLFVGSVIACDDDPSGKIGKVKFTVQPNSNIVPTHASAS